MFAQSFARSNRSASGPANAVPADCVLDLGLRLLPGKSAEEMTGEPAARGGVAGPLPAASGELPLAPTGR